MPPLVIESEAMRVGVLPEFGARVVSLFDKAAGREWLLQGDVSANTGEDAVYGAGEAVGWDECFPTVSPCDATGTIWGRRLRDHGDLWGRPWAVDEHGADALSTTCATAEFAFTRRLALDGATLTARYRVENRTGTEMPFLWALHGLLAAPPGDRIVLPGVTELSATYLGRDGEDLAASDSPDPLPQLATPATSTLSWPDTRRDLGFRLDEVQPAASGFAGKFYGEPARPFAAVGHDGQWLVIGWSAPLTTLGVWLNYHGWPTPPHGHHLALEPTTAPADHLAGALQAGRAARLAPGAAATWTVTLTLSRTAP